MVRTSIVQPLPYLETALKKDNRDKASENKSSNENTHIRHRRWKLHKQRMEDELDNQTEHIR